MDGTFANFSQLAGTTKTLALRVLAVAENRVQLLMVEVQEERERLLRAMLLALGATVFALLAGITLTVTIVLCLWTVSPITTLVVLTILYAGCATWLYTNFSRLIRDWKTLPGTVDQLRKDRECLERNLN